MRAALAARSIGANLSRMRVPFLLFFASSLALAASLSQPDLIDFSLVAAASVVASLWLLFRAWRARKPRRKRVIVDGSNVLHWKDGTPQIETLCEVLARLKADRLDPIVMFDANAGYLIAGRYQHDHAMACKLGLPTKSVLVVSKGSVADETILAAARDLKARVVSNDRYRDWADRHPEVLTPGHLIRGGYRDGALWLDPAP